MSFQVLKLKAYACLAVTPNSRQAWTYSQKKKAGMHSLALPNWLTRHSPFKKPSSQTYEIIKTLLVENAALMESYDLLKAPVIYIVG
jgi:hypothetical protein